MLRLRHSGAPMDISISRRGFVAGGCAFASMFAVGGAAYALSGDDLKPLRPPGAQDAAHFAATCLKCNRCESACPSNTYLSFAGGKQRGINVEIARGEA